MASKRTKPLQRTQGLGCARRRSRPRSRRPPRRGSARADRASRAGCPCGARARALRSPLGASSRTSSPSPAGSAQSSSVTATTSSPASSASCAAAALSTPPLIATSVRRGCGASRGAPVARGRAERAVEGVGGELGGVALRGDEPAERRGDVVGRDPSRLEERPALDQLDERAAGGDERAAAARVEAGLGDAIAVHAHGHAHEVAACGAPGGTGVGRVRESSPSCRRAQMIPDRAHRVLR